MKFTVSTSSITKKGIVYILELRLENKLLIKVGYTSRRKVEDRVCEILTSIWKKYRIFPQCYVKRYKEVPNPVKIEQALHQELKDSRYTTKHKFSGSTEIFSIPLETVVDLYDKLLDKDIK